MFEIITGTDMSKKVVNLNFNINNYNNLLNILNLIPDIFFNK